jgi:hypothetical protein
MALSSTLCAAVGSLTAVDHSLQEEAFCRATKSSYATCFANLTIVHTNCGCCCCCS